MTRVLLLLTACLSAAVAKGPVDKNMASPGNAIAVGALVGSSSHMESSQSSSQSSQGYGQSSSSNSGSLSSSNQGSTTNTVAVIGGETVIISVGVTVIGSTSGGSSGWTQISTPNTTTGMNHQVTVGGSAGLVYSPSTINAAIGDMVTFTFMSTNHTVTQSAFTAPCVKLANAMDSGFMPNPNNTVSPPPVFQVQVTSTDPVWFYCRQTGHCGKGMTFSINPSATKTQAMFQAMAIAQNGTTTSTTTGSSSIAPPPPPTTSTAEPIAAASSVSVSTPAPPSVQAGTGTTDSNGECSCSCLCGVSAFPAMAGLNNFGGMGGSMAMS